MDVDQVLAFRLARSGLATRRACDLAEAVACPASDVSRDAALLTLGARVDGVSRERYRRAVDVGDVVLAHALRGAIHALAPVDLALWGRALVGRDDGELAAQLGPRVQLLAAGKQLSPRAALDEVAAAIDEALGKGRPLTRDDLHDEMRRRVRADLVPWCPTCKSHHVAPMLWRYGAVVAGARLDAERRFLRAAPGRAPAAGEVVRRFLRFYGPARPGEFADWAGLAKTHARRLWGEAAGGLTEVRAGEARAWLPGEDVEALEAPAAASGVRLLPAGDPYLQRPNRPLLVPDAALRRRLFRPVASPGAVLADGRLAGLWRVRIRGRRAEIAVEALGRLPRAALEDEAYRVAWLRGADEAAVAIA